MKAQTLILLSVLLLADLGLAAPSKRIEVFLDISGSMKPSGSPAGSPYDQAVRALMEILDRDEIVGDDDEIEVTLFGETLVRTESARGSTEVRALLRQLARDNATSNLSDFEPVLQRLDQSAAATGTFDRTLVIIASDFVHEPPPFRTRPPADDLLDRWHRMFPAYRDAVAGRFEHPRFQTLVLLRAAPITDRLLAVQEKVLGDLRAAANSRVASGSGDAVKVFPVGRGESPEALARDIRAQFLFGIEVQARLAFDGRERTLVVDLQNPNRVPLTLRSVSARCVDGAGQPRGDSVPIPELRRLAASGKASGTLEVSWTTCADDSTASLLVEAISDLGARGSTRVRLGSYVELVGTDVALSEWSSFRGETLRVWLQLRGQSIEPSEHRIILRQPGRNEVLVEGRFVAPSDLDPTEAKSYEFVIPKVPSHLLDHLDQLEADIGGGRPFPTPLGAARASSWVNQANLVLGFFLIPLFLVIAQFQRKAGRSTSERILVAATILATISAVGAAVFFFLQRFPGYGHPLFNPRTLIRLGTLGLACMAATWVGLHWHNSRKFEARLRLLEDEASGEDPLATLQTIFSTSDQEARPFFISLAVASLVVGSLVTLGLTHPDSLRPPQARPAITVLLD